jgi:S-adenosylmethionine:tRNA ribosyltransferase-isomerase
MGPRYRSPVRTAEFDYALPPELIAQEPLAERDGSRLLVLDRGTGTPRHRGADVRHLTFQDFPGFLESGDLLVINDSRVIPARLLPKRAGGGHAEVLLVHREAEGPWIALVRPGQRIHTGTVLALDGGDRIEVVAHLPTGERRVRLVGEGGDDGVLARHGHVPLPPYIHRPDTPADRERYQTVYAREPGSVAAPTAGLHFTPEILRRIEERGVRIERVTLHVGPGTFRPVHVEDVSQHRMDSECYSIPEATADAVRATREAGGRVWAVGTTALRALESAADPDTRRLAPGTSWTSLFVTPGHTFRVVDRLLTNFHLPKSTLLMLVCAFAGTERTLAAYREAVEQRYRFYSYGDAMAVL